VLDIKLVANFFIQPCKS